MSEKTNYQTGRDAESAVAFFMQRKGYQIYDRNYRVYRVGELDLIAGRGRKIIFIEVKARWRTETWGGLRATISRDKLIRIKKTALCYIKEKHFMNKDMYFLAAFVELDKDKKPINIFFEPIEWQ